MRKLQNEELQRISIEEFKSRPKTPIILVLDNVRSLHNVGAAFRTADAFLLEKIYLLGITGKPPHREIQKTALGATESVAWEHRPEGESLMDELKQKGWTLIALEQTDQSTSLQDFQPQKEASYALIFGNEVFGVQDSLLAKTHHCIEIPQSGTKHSFNISVSMGIALWDFWSKLNP